MDSVIVHVVPAPKGFKCGALDKMPQSWLCIDCGANTAPGAPTRAEVRGETVINWHSGCEIYAVQDVIWAKAGMVPLGGCLCIGCLEKRLGRELEPKDVLQEHYLNNPELPGTVRLNKRRDV
jgi:hypothetical protein